MEEKKLKVAMYCRVGNPDQLEIEKQETEIQKYCKQMGHQIFKSYVDNGYSAKSKNRPGYNLLIEGMKQKRFDMIITTSLDRLNRPTKELLKLIDLSKSYNCKIKTLYEDIDTSTAYGRLFVNTLNIMEEYMKGSYRSGKRRAKNSSNIH